MSTLVSYFDHLENKAKTLFFGKRKLKGPDVDRLIKILKQVIEKEAKNDELSTV